MRYANFVLTIIALAVGTLVLERIARPAPAAAQSADPDLNIEPGQTMLRKLDGTATVLGKIVINKRTGDIWGFPTGSESPYPITPARKEAPISKPMYLGRFDFAATAVAPQ